MIFDAAACTLDLSGTRCACQPSVCLDSPWSATGTSSAHRLMESHDGVVGLCAPHCRNSCSGLLEFHGQSSGSICLIYLCRHLGLFEYYGGALTVASHCSIFRESPQLFTPSQFQLCCSTVAILFFIHLRKRYTLTPVLPSKKLTASVQLAPGPCCKTDLEGLVNLSVSKV